MNEHKKIAVNTLTQIVGKAVSIALAILTVGIMTRYLGPEQFGWYSTAFTYLQLFGVFIDFGLTLVTTQMISEHGAEENKIIGNLMGLRTVTALIFFIIAPIIILALPYPLQIKAAVAVLSVSFFCISLGQIFTGILQRHMAMWWVTIAENLMRAFQIMGIGAIMFFDAGFLNVMIVLSAASVIQVVALGAATRRFAALSLKFEPVIWLEIIKRAWPIAISIIFNLIYLRGDIFVMSLTRAQEEVGLYGAAFKVIDVLNTVPFLFMGVVLPVLTLAWSQGNKEKFNKFLQMSFDSLVFMCVPLAFGGFVLAPQIMRILGGAEFTGAGVFLKILLIAIIGVYAGAAFSHAIVAINRQRSTIWVYAVNALIAVVGYILFIPRYGGIAGAIITAINELLVPLLIFIITWRIVRFHLQFTKAAKIIVASVIMTLVVFPFRELGFFVPLLIGIIVYVALSLVFGIIKLKDYAHWSLYNKK